MSSDSDAERSLSSADWINFLQREAHRHATGMETERAALNRLAVSALGFALLVAGGAVGGLLESDGLLILLAIPVVFSIAWVMAVRTISELFAFAEKRYLTEMHLRCILESFELKGYRTWEVGDDEVPHIRNTDRMLYPFLAAISVLAGAATFYAVWVQLPHQRLIWWMTLLFALAAGCIALWRYSAIRQHQNEFTRRAAGV